MSKREICAAEKKRGALLPDELILRHERKRLVPLSDATIWRLERRDEFPRRISISPGRVAWRRSEIEAWLELKQRASLNLLSTAVAPCPLG
jgi:prophage regulatory protein